MGQFTTSLLKPGIPDGHAGEDAIRSVEWSLNIPPR
jgi:hypothetical protein